MVTALLIGWGALLLVLERIIPATIWPDDRGRVLRNLAFGILALIASPLIQWATQAVMSGVAPVLETHVLAQLLILDLWAYLLHRGYHRIPTMWRLHSVHHFDEHLDVTSAVRFHLGEIIWSSILRLIPLTLFGISLEVNLLYGAILSGSAMFHHSNVRLPPLLERVLSWVIVTPSIHWVHHHAVQCDTDANYASILSVWDRLFGSRSPTPRTPGMAIGVEGAREKSFARLLLHPMR
jgi:sterol desaturase/sphingolipid hydroxylase (fatty acid hydroxylase superfamily)